MSFLDYKTLANIFITHFNDKGTPIRHMKLQKLLYMLCGWHYAVFNEWVVEKDFEAWAYGPVYRDLYNELSEHGSAPITEELFKKEDHTVPNAGAEIPKQVEETAKKIIERYGYMDDLHLSNITHAHGTPWRGASKRGFYEPIKRDLVKAHYKKLIQVFDNQRVR